MATKQTSLADRAPSRSPAASPKRRVGVYAALFGVIVIASIALAVAGWKKERTAVDSPRVRAPDFPGISEWLNTDEPITIARLRGHVVLVDFWTYCCINCMHVFPELKFLEDKYKDEPFVVIGVHSGKFDQEKDASNIRQAILRHNITHPVAVDSDFTSWQAFGARSWPTLVLIDAEGRVVGGVSGEGHREMLDGVIRKTLDEASAKGVLAEEPMRFALERESFESGVLEYPGKVLADAKRNRLFIADTNHHRVLITDLDGKVARVIGDGRIGLKDGPFDAARFHQPQGMASSENGELLYVADTENHAIRLVNLKEQTVETIAGNGEPSYDRSPNGPAKTTPLSSPWALELIGHTLYVATAGLHQLWRIDLDAGRVSVHAGTGHERRVDGPNARAAFAQPSGLATDGKELFVADAEISTIRAVGLEPRGVTRTVAGSGGLFDFGLTDGVGEQARFQHPLGVAYTDGRLYVADTFNHVIRQVSVASGNVTTWLGTGKPGPGDEKAIAFFEPGGLSIGNGILYVADTNNHRIVAVDLLTKAARPLRITLPKSATPAAAQASR